MAYTEFYCQTTGSNLNAGSTTADAAVYTATNGGWNSGTGVFTPTSGDPSATVSVGDFASIFLDAATVAVFVARVTAVSSTTITVSTTAKSGTAPTTAANGITCKVGGAWKGPNGTSGFPFGFVQSTMTNASSNPPRVNLKSGTSYSITSGISQGNSSLTFQGYTSSPGDGGRAVIEGPTTGASFILLNLFGSGCVLRDLSLRQNGNSGTSAGLYLNNVELIADRIVVDSVRGAGIVSDGVGIICHECEVFSCNQSNTSSVGAFNCVGQGGVYVRCVSHNNSGSNVLGFNNTNNNAVYIECISDTNGSHGFQTTGGVVSRLWRCTSYGNTGAGFATNGGGVAENCIFANNGTYGVSNGGSGANNVEIYYCGFYSNTSGETNGLNASRVVGSITFSTAPMTDPANGDFSPATAEVKNAGRGAFTQDAGSYSATTTSYPDVGAVQHQETAGGGSSVPSINFGQSGVRIV